MKVKFNSLNEAISVLPYARIYQGPMEKENEFNIEVECINGGNYNALKELIELAKKEGFKYKTYFQINECYTAKMYIEKGKIECSFDQTKVYIIN